MEDEGEDDHLTDGIVRVRDEDRGNEGYVDRDGAENGRNEEWPRTFASLDVEEEGDTEEYPDGTNDGGPGLDVLTSECLSDGDAIIGMAASEMSKEDA